MNGTEPIEAGDTSEAQNAPSSSLQDVVRELLAENARLRESQTECRRIIASLVEEAGGEMRVNHRTLMLIPLQPEIITWSEPGERKMVIRVSKPKLPNGADGEALDGLESKAGVETLVADLEAAFVLVEGWYADTPEDDAPEYVKDLSWLLTVLGKCLSAERRRSATGGNDPS